MESLDRSQARDAVVGPKWLCLALCRDRFSCGWNIYCLHVRAGGDGRPRPVQHLEDPYKKIEPLEQIEFMQNLADKDRCCQDGPLPRYLMVLKIAKCEAKVLSKKRRAAQIAPVAPILAFFSLALERAHSLSCSCTLAGLFRPSAFRICARVSFFCL